MGSANRVWPHPLDLEVEQVAAGRRAPVSASCLFGTRSLMVAGMTLPRVILLPGSVLPAALVQLAQNRPTACTPAAMCRPRASITTSGPTR